MGIVLETDYTGKWANIRPLGLAIDPRSSGSTTDGIRVIPRKRISWSVQPTRLPPDLATFTTAAAVGRSCFANQLSLRGGNDPRRSVPQSSVLTSSACPYLWSHSFPPQVGLGLGDLPLLTSDCCQEGKSALTLLCRILLLPTTCASRSNPFETQDIGDAPSCKKCQWSLPNFAN